MVDSGTARLGKKVKAITTEVKTKKDTSLQIYKVEGAKKVDSAEFVICHKKNYAYAVFKSFIGIKVLTLKFTWFL
nr:hypothetical protein [Tanacetum cinerariifolium]